MKTPDLAAMCGASVRQLDHWARRGFLKPGGRPGSGNLRDWDTHEVIMAQRMARLVAAGFEVGAAARYARDGWPSAEVAPGIRVEVSA